MLKRSNLTTSNNNIFFQSLSILGHIIIPLLAYICILYFDIPRQLGLSFRYGFTTIILPCLIILLITFHLPGRIWSITSLTLTMVLFALPLSGLWMSGAGEKIIIAGLFPWSDANAYYDSATQLLEGGIFAGIAARRPLFPGMLATALWLGQQNLQISMAIMTVVAAISCYFLVREVQRVNGTAAAVLLLLFLFIYHRRFVGSTMSENLGLPLGVLGFSFLLRGNRLKKKWVLLAGFLIITLALNARAGAFFILPMLILWYLTLEKHDHWKDYISPVLVGIIPVVLGFGINMFMFNSLSSPDALPFSNFSYTLYGVATGGNSWEQLLYDYPELRYAPTEEFNQKSYELAFDEIKKNPFGIVKGSFHAISDFFSLKDIGAFGYINTDSVLLSKILRLFVYLAGAIGVIYCCRNMDDSYNRLLIFSLVGIILSIPFAPPIDAEKMRAYAATITFLGILPVIGFVSIVNRIKPDHLLTTPSEATTDTALLPFTISYILIILIMPLILLNTSQKPEYKKISCPPDQDVIYIRYTPGSYITVLEEEKVARTHLPLISWNTYDRSIHNSMHSVLVPEFTAYEPPFTLINTLDFNKWHQIWLFVDPDMLPGAPVMLGVCGTYSSEDPDNWLLQAMYARSVNIVSLPEK